MQVEKEVRKSNIGNFPKEEKRLISEAEYRAIKDRLSYSAIKLFKDNRVKFWKKHILGELVEESKSVSMVLGNLVDVMLLSPQEFDNQFAVASVPKPVGQMGLFTDALLEKTFRCLNCDNELSVEFTTLFLETLEYRKLQGDFKGKTAEKVLEAFTTPDKNGSIPEQYYKEGRLNHGKQIVDLNMLSTAERMVESLKTSPYVGNIVNLESSDNIEVHNQLGILFDILGTPFKALLDKVVINHKTKTVQIYDLKTVYSSTAFPYQYYKMGYYIQVGVYQEAIRCYMEQRGWDYTNWKVLYPEFIVVDSSGNNKPLLFTTNIDNLKESIDGFTSPSGLKIKGVLELVTEIQKHLELNEWQYSIEAIENNGKLAIKPYSLVEKEEE